MSQTVSRAIDVLEFCSGRPRALQEIADRFGVHRTTALRLIQTLSAGGFVRKDEYGRYGVGFRLVGLAESALRQFDLRSVVRPHIVALSRRVGNTVQFAVPQEDRIVYVDKEEPADSIHLDTRIGGFVVLHTAGVSKAILAHLEPKAREAFLAGTTFERFTRNTLTSRAEFDARLEAVRTNGWAYDDGEYEEISNCIAAPVWDHAGHVAGSISITTLKPKVDLSRLREFLPALLETTAAISAELGGRTAEADTAGESDSD